MLQKLGFIIRPLFNNCTYTIRWGIGKGFKRKGGMQFIPQITPLRKEELFLQTLDLSGQTIFDIGGFEGIFSLFFSKCTGKNGTVFTFEPNPINFSKINTNIKLNNISNIKVFNTAIGNESGTAQLTFDESMRESGSLSTSVSVTSTGGSQRVFTKEVLIEKIDNLLKIHSLPDPDFIKIDVEGFENDVLMGMNELIARKKPALFIENHTFRFTKKADKDTYISTLINFLLQRGYSIKHIERDILISDKPGSDIPDGHFYAK